MMRVARRRTRLVFETDDFVFEGGRRHQVVIEARPAYAMVRLKRQRKAFAIPYSAVYHAAVRMQVEAERRAKKAAKK